VGTQGLLGVALAVGSGLAGSLGGLLLQLVPLDTVQEVGSTKKKIILKFRTEVMTTAKQIK